MKKQTRTNHIVVCPILDEQETLHIFYMEVKKHVLDSLENSKLVFVDDGSSDSSWDLILDLCKSDRRVKGIRLSRNFGQQNAIYAGLSEFEADTYSIIDVDLQDPPAEIPLMLNHIHEGYEIVYGKRTKRNGERVFKKFTAIMFYRILEKIVSFNMPINSGDFRVVTLKAVNEIKRLRDRELYLRGMFAYTGLPALAHEYVRQERVHGESKYGIKRMFNLARVAIFSFSLLPLSLTIYIFMSLASLSLAFTLLLIFGLLQEIPIEILGVTTCVVLICLAILARYIYSIFVMSQQRPRYIIREFS